MRSLVPIGTNPTKESIMRTSHQTPASALRAASFAAFSALVSVSAMATGGSTDFYGANGVTASFGAPAQPSASSVVVKLNGSTDMWSANGFRASFGPSVSAAPSSSACDSGSTDLYGAKAFVASFGASASRAGDELAQACQAPATVVR
jgi:hypothetical protein